MNDNKQNHKLITARILELFAATGPGRGLRSLVVGLTMFTFVTIVNAATISAPVLVAPANQSSDNPIRVTLEWKAAAGATAYDYQVTDGATVVASGNSIQALSASVTLTEDTTYAWHVRGRNSYGAGAWSGSWTFKTRPPLAAPLLLSPADGTVFPNNGVSKTDVIELNWQPVEDATGYDYEILQNGEIIVSDSGSGYPPVIEDLPAGTYQWYVRAKTSLRTGPWSDAGNFEVQPFTPIGTPAPVPNVFVFPGDPISGTVGRELFFYGYVTVNGQPAGPPEVYSWWTPMANVTFSNPNSPITGVTFSAPGSYKLQLTAHDVDGDVYGYGTVTATITW